MDTKKFKTGNCGAGGLSVGDTDSHPSGPRQTRLEWGRRPISRIRPSQMPAMANSESHREVLRRASDESSRVAHMVQDMVSEKVAIIKPPWMLELGLPRLDTDIMGRIWSFQRKDVYKSTCYISLATMAADVKSDRSNVKKRIDKLVELGLLIKSPRGNNKSVEYRLDMTAIAKRRLEVEEGKKKQRAENSAKRKAQWDAKHSA